MCACVMNADLPQSADNGMWLMAYFVSVQFLLHMFSNSEEIEMEVLLTSLLVLYRMYYKGLMISMVPTGVRKTYLV